MWWVSQEEIKGAIRKAQGTRVNVIEQWEEEVAQESECGNRHPL